MAWVRIHDGALTHPKLIGIFDPRRPLDLWLWGLAYAQQYLTDGLIPSEAIPRGSEKARTRLVLKHLWEARDDGNFEIHDYGDWNEARGVVLEKRAAAKARMERFRNRVSNAEPTLNERGTEREVTGSNTTTTTKDPKKKKGARPIYQGQRFDVFPWMVSKLERILGADAYAWVVHLDEQAAMEGLVVPGNTAWNWIEDRAIGEAHIRGSVVVGGNGKSSEWTCPHDPKCATASFCDITTKLGRKSYGSAEKVGS